MCTQMKSTVIRRFTDGGHLSVAWDVCIWSVVVLTQSQRRWATNPVSTPTLLLWRKRQHWRLQEIMNTFIRQVGRSTQ